ncbi:site-specific integrase [uncultured Paludibaculum sp.]|uniref:site-specific integrase n=1 Tax=uncultured Paludibaculum sp. TaxID=1765020 RepID=UPI002AABDC61|nr:site-specific integrase [uncultured Paludibaculum sp.]
MDRSLEQTKVGGLVFKEPKTRIRTVALPPLVIEALDELRAEQIATMEMLGQDGYEQNDLICCLPDGGLWKPSAFTSCYRALLSRRKVSGPNFHALRHSHASHLLRAGVDLKEISSRLGHSRASFTLSTYMHLLPGQDHEAARRTDEILRKAIDNQKKLVAMPKPAKAG